MLSMNIMPWGTLGSATVVGAMLAQMSVSELAWHTALASALVFPLLALVALYVIGGLSILKHNALVALGLSGLLSIALFSLSYLQMVEIAGILAGMLVCLIGLCLLPTNARALDTNTSTVQYRQTWLALLPYGGVLALILVMHKVPVISVFLNNTWVFSGADVSLHVLSSPRIALLLATLLMYLRRPRALPHQVLLKRTWIVGLSLFVFILLAQTMCQSNMLASFASALTTWNADLLVLLSSLMGMVSGFITGSNLSGNALLMAVQTHMGANLNALGIFAGAQNSSSGHAVFTSIPIIVLILTLAKETSSRAIKQVSIHHLLLFGLRISVLILPVTSITTWTLYHFVL